MPGPYASSFEALTSKGYSGWTALTVAKAHRHSARVLNDDKFLMEASPQFIADFMVYLCLTQLMQTSALF